MFLKRVVLAALGALLVLGCEFREVRYGQEPAARPVAVYERITEDQAKAWSESVVMILVYRGAECLGQGSGIVVAQVGFRHDPSAYLTLVLTAAHMTDDGADSWVALHDGKIFVGKLIARGKSDWAMLEFVGRLLKPLGGSVYPDMPPVGTPITAIGYPLGKFAITYGVVREHVNKEVGLLNYTARTYPGSSGGAVIGSVGGKPILLAVHVQSEYADPFHNEWIHGSGTPIQTVLTEGGYW